MERYEGLTLGRPVVRCSGNVSWLARNCTSPARGAAKLLSRDWVLDWNLSAVLERWIGGGGGSRTRVRKCYWSRDYMLIHVHAPGITQGRSRPPLRTDKKRLSL